MSLQRDGTRMNAGERLCLWLETLDLKHIALFLFALTFVVHFAALLILKIHPTIEFAEMENIARSLAEKGAFANPYKIPCLLYTSPSPRDS